MDFKGMGVVGAGSFILEYRHTWTIQQKGLGEQKTEQEGIKVVSLWKNKQKKRPTSISIPSSFIFNMNSSTTNICIFRGNHFDPRARDRWRNFGL